jgi:hypothetical protein
MQTLLRHEAVAQAKRAQEAEERELERLTKKERLAEEEKLARLLESELVAEERRLARVREKEQKQTFKLNKMDSIGRRGRVMTSYSLTSAIKIDGI